VNYRPNQNIVLRPEARWDWYAGPRNPYGELPFNTFNSSTQFTAAVDMIVAF
jgi:hypothetical protein